MDHILFKSELHLTAVLLFKTVLGCSVHVCLYHLKNLLRSSSWLMLCYRGNLLQSIRLCLLGSTTLCPSGHGHLHWLHHVLKSDMLTVNHSPAHFFLFAFLFQLYISSRGCLSWKRVWSPGDSFFLMWLSLLTLYPLIRPFILRVLGFLCPVVSPALQEFQAFVLMLHNMAFQLPNKVVALPLDNNTAKAY